MLDDLVKAGRLGQKNGKGFRKYNAKGKAEADPAVVEILDRHKSGDHVPSESEVTDRLFLAMFLEAARAVEEGIVRTAAEADLGLILGIGFPPFKGGILRWADAEGLPRVLDRIGNYQHLGKRFEAPEIVKKLARDGGTFYPKPASGSKFGG